MNLRPMVRMSPFDSASASVVAAMRVVAISIGSTGSTERAKVSGTGARTCARAEATPWPGWTMPGSTGRALWRESVRGAADAACTSLAERQGDSRPVFGVAAVGLVACRLESERHVGHVVARRREAPAQAVLVAVRSCAAAQPGCCGEAPGECRQAVTNLRFTDHICFGLPLRRPPPRRWFLASTTGIGASPPGHFPQAVPVAPKPVSGGLARLPRAGRRRRLQSGACGQGRGGLSVPSR